MDRIVEAYVGEYASGKSENAVNRAIEIKNKYQGKATLVDLDTVEPFYTLRPLKRKLKEEFDIDVVAWETSETIGLGEAGSVIKPEMRWVLRKEGNLVLDIGYGVHGAKILNLIEEVDQCPEFRIYAVINASRPMTSTVEDIVEYVKTLGRIDGLVNNTNLGDETTADVINEGSDIVGEAASKLDIPIIYTAVDQSLAEHFTDRDKNLNPIKRISRFMPNSMW